MVRLRKWGTLGATIVVVLGMAVSLLVYRSTQSVADLPIAQAPSADLECDTDRASTLHADGAGGGERDPDDAFTELLSLHFPRFTPEQFTRVVSSGLVQFTMKEEGRTAFVVDVRAYPDGTWGLASYSICSSTSERGRKR